MKHVKLTTLSAILLAVSLIAIPACARSASDTSSDTAELITDTVEISTQLSGSESTEKSVEHQEESVLFNELEKNAETEAKETETASLRFTDYGNGTCAVSGIGNCTDLFIVIPERCPDGNVVTAIEDRAFYGNKEIKAVEIPSTVSSIGEMAFGNCPALVYISVDKANKAFKDVTGVLYSKDGSTLIAYPAACGATTLDLSKTVTRISDMAFYGCDTLQVIAYSGSLSDWSNIRIGEMNYGLFTASVSCAGK